MAKFWVRTGMTLEIDNKELEGKTLKEIHQLLGKKINNVQQRVNTNDEYFDGDTYFPIWLIREELIKNGLINEEVTEADLGDAGLFEYDF